MSRKGKVLRGKTLLLAVAGGVVIAAIMYQEATYRPPKDLPNTQKCEICGAHATREVLRDDVVDYNVETRYVQRNHHYFCDSHYRQNEGSEGVEFALFVGFIGFGVLGWLLSRIL